MERLKLKAEVREESGSRSARRLREQGEVPAVLYGHHHTPVSLTIHASDLRHLVGKNALIDVEFGEDVETVVLKDVQVDTVRRDYLHADLQAVSLDEQIHITVPIHLEGIQAVQKRGGVVQHHLHEVEVECLPENMPDQLTLDISMLEPGDFVAVRHLALNSADNFNILTPANDVVASVGTPGLMEDEDSTTEQGIATMSEAIPQDHDPTAEEATNREEIETE